MLLCSMGITAQTYYYNTTKTFTGNGYAYQCDVDNGTTGVTLYNKANTWTYVRQTYRDGTPLTMEFRRHVPKLLEDDDWTKPLCNSIVNQAFSTAEKQRVAGREIEIALFVNPDTGKVMEVSFWFIRNNSFATIPVSVYRTIELELKSRVWFTPTSDGRNVNRIMRFWRHEVK